MNARHWGWLGIVVVALSVATLSLAACSGGGGAKFAHVKAGDMPQGEEWPGVYYNPVYGYLHMIEQDGSIVGRWKRTDGSHWGELSGTVEGNVLHFTWKEHKYGAVGPSADSKGTGIFVYKMGEKFGELDGQYALDDSDQVGEWHCVKQAGMKPDINSINGKGTDNMGVTPDTWK
ncbi:MAG TPA: hypothetical protein VGG39_22070 [Polyangiaceae bacterium]|jgi:hypothetical protein